MDVQDTLFLYLADEILLDELLQSREVAEQAAATGAEDTTRLVVVAALSDTESCQWRLPLRFC